MRAQFAADFDQMVGRTHSGEPFGDAVDGVPLGDAGQVQFDSAQLLHGPGLAVETDDAPARQGAGGLDLFLEEDIEYARRLTAAGVAAELLVVPGAYHGFDVLAPEAGVSRRFRQARLAALARALGRP